MDNSLRVMVAAAGRPHLLRRTLKSIADCSKPANYAGTLIIENGPPSGIKAIVNEFSRHLGFRYLYNDTPNKSEALNLGLAHAGGGLIVFADDDVRVHPNWLLAYAAGISQNSRAQFFGGPIHVDAEFGLPPVWMRRYYPLPMVVAWELPHTGVPTPVPGQHFMGANWAAFAEEIANCGGFDPKLGPRSDQSVGEETEVQRRLVNRGSTPVYVPAALTWHYLPQEYLDPAWLLTRTYRHGLAWGIAQTRGGQAWSLPIMKAALRRMNCAAKCVWLRLLGGEEREFRAQYLTARWKGRWDGLLQGRHWADTNAMTSSGQHSPDFGRVRAA